MGGAWVHLTSHISHLRYLVGIDFNDFSIISFLLLEYPHSSIPIAPDQKKQNATIAAAAADDDDELGRLPGI